MFSWKNTQIQAIETSIPLIGLSEPQKTILFNRFMTVLRNYQTRKIRYAVAFHFLRGMITIGSLIVPALLSVQYTSGNVSMTTAKLSSEVYWIVWILSLFVTISNGVMSLMKVDKKYFVFHTVFEQLLSEAWQYIELTGRYAGQQTPLTPTPTHATQFPVFCHQIEKIRMRQVEDEYYKVMEHANHTNKTTNDSIVPPTPFRGIPGLTATQWAQQQADMLASSSQQQQQQQQQQYHQPVPNPLYQEQVPLPQVNGGTQPQQQQNQQGQTALRRYNTEEGQTTTS